MALTDYVIMPGADYQALCDKIREKTGKTDVIKSGDLVTEIDSIGGGAAGQYIEYTFNAEGEAVTAALHGFTTIPDGCFAYMKSLVSVDITDSPGITSIGNHAFYYCNALTSFVIPDTVTSIGEYAFCQCTSLEAINIPSAITSIGRYAFQNCKVATGNIVIPGTVTTIETYAFSTCSALESVTISEGVTNIDAGAFMSCSALTSINIPSTVTKIGYRAFYGCSAMASAVFEVTSGWWYASSATATSGTEIASTDLADATTASGYLTNTYAGKYWSRS